MAAIGKFALYANMAGKLRFHRRFEDIGVWIADPVQGTGSAPPHSCLGVPKIACGDFPYMRIFIYSTQVVVVGKPQCRGNFPKWPVGDWRMPPW